MANTAANGYVDEDALAALRAHFSDGQILEIAMCCAVLSGMAKLLFAFDLAEREDYCPFPRPLDQQVKQVAGLSE